MNGYADSGGTAKAVCVFVGLLLAIAVVGGVYLGNSELFSPSVHAAKADKLKAEAAVLREQTEYERSKHEIELEALQRRRDKQLELMEPIAIVGMVVGCTVVLAVGAAVSYKLVKGASVSQNRPVANAKPQSVSEPNLFTSSERLRQESASKPRHSPINRASIDPSEPTYDGLLAYCCDFLLPVNGTEPFYAQGITPEVTDFYLRILSEARIITCGINGRTEWTLRRQIKGLGDVRLRISRQAFESLGDLELPSDSAEQMVFHEMGLEHDLYPVMRIN
jgi:hypothetical protein